MKEQWMKDMQDRFADFEQPAPEGLLDDIQREMEHRGLVPVNKASDTQRRLIPLWMRGAAAAAIVAVAIGTGTLLLTDDNNLPKPVAQEQTVETQTLPTYIDEPKNEIAEAMATQKPKQMVRNRKISELLSTAPTVAKEDLMAETLPDTATESEHIDAELPPTVIVNDVQETKQEELIQESDVEYTTTVPVVSQTPSAASTKTYQPKRSKSGNKRWEIGASMAGMQGLGSPNYDIYLYGNRISKNGMDFLNSVVKPSDIITTHPDHDHGVAIGDGNGHSGNSDYTPPANPGYDNPTTPVEDYNNGGIISGFSNYSSNYIPTRSGNNNTSDHVMINNRMYSMISDTHHRQPVKVGLSMRYHFNDRWSLQAGVDYSYHSSDLVLQIENVQIQSEQKLHFVGVPVSLAYSLWSPGRFNVYLSGGGEIEKVVKGSQSIMSMTSNMADRKERQDV